MARNKTSNDRPSNWGSLGGNTPMHSFRPTGTQTADRTSQEPHSGSRRDIAPLAGGPEAGFYGDASKGGREMKGPAPNEFGAGPQAPGVTATTGARQAGFAHGGNTSMFGNRGSLKARGGHSAPE